MLDSGSERDLSLSLFQRATHSNTGIINLRLTLEEHMSNLWPHLNYTIDDKPPNPSAINEILDGRLFYHDALFCAVPSIVGKVNSL